MTLLAETGRQVNFIEYASPSSLEFGFNGDMPEPKYVGPVGDIPTGSPLDKIYQRLMSPFVGKTVRLDAGQILTFASQDSEIVAQAAEVVDYAYNTRYHHNSGEVVTLSSDRYAALPTTRTIAAVHYIDGQAVVLGTFRTITGADLDVFELFEMREGYEWPHLINGQSLASGELGRFSLSPVFDALRVNGTEGISKIDINKMRKTILQRMWKVGIGQMRNDGVEVPYFILAPEVKEFVVGSGIIPVIVEGEKLNQSEYARGIRQAFPEYWRPEGLPEVQPQVYIAPWDIVSA